jgi:hypothetical protein
MSTCRRVVEVALLLIGLSQIFLSKTGFYRLGRDLSSLRLSALEGPYWLYGTLFPAGGWTASGARAVHIHPMKHYKDTAVENVVYCR